MIFSYRKIIISKEVSETLKELWISYNSISTLEGLSQCFKLKVLYIGNNNISDYKELNVLANLTQLEDAVFKGNPCCLEGGNIMKPADLPFNIVVSEIKSRIPSLVTLDGELCKNYEDITV